jgi:transposase
MPRPPRVYRLTATQRTQLRARLHQHWLAPRTRIRLECVQLADLGWTAPQIAAQVGVCEHTVRRALQRVVAGGLDALADRPRSGRPPALDGAALAAVEDLLRRAARRGEAWTAGQLAGWLATTHGVTISPGRLRTLLRQRGCCWTRPQPT